MSRPAVIKKLEKVRDSYYNEVYTKCHRKTPKHRNERIPTIPSQSKVWRSKIIDMKGHTYGSMFDIGVKMEELNGAEKVFYEDQKGERKFRISEEIDSGYIAQKEQEWLEQQQRKEEDLEFQGTKDVEDVEIDEVPSSPQPDLNNSFTRPGLSRITKPCQSITTQTEYEVVKGTLMQN